MWILFRSVLKYCFVKSGLGVPGDENAGSGWRLPLRTQRKKVVVGRRRLLNGLIVDKEDI